MNFEDILKRNPNLTVKDLQELQRDYDARFVAKKGFVGFNKIRHTYEHMGKLIGRLADYVHDMEENGSASEKEIKEKVIPDLLVYSAWLAGELGVDMEEAYLGRFVNNLERLYSEQVSKEEMQSIKETINSRSRNI